MRYGAGLREALRPPTGLAGGGGERAPVCSLALVTPGDTPPLPTPSHPLFLPTVAPLRAAHQPRALRTRSALCCAGNSWMERWPVTPVAPPEPGRDGQRREGARSEGAGVRTNAGRLAPSPPPSPAGCREGAQRRRGLPGSLQRCDGGVSGPGRMERGRQHSSVRAGLWPLTAARLSQGLGAEPRDRGRCGEQSQPGEVCNPAQEQRA